MCMFVTHKITGINSLILETRKILTIIGGQYKTPSYYTSVPDDGWLFPFRYDKQYGYLVNQSITDGVIHSYSKSKPGMLIGNISFAFNVKAYGDIGDVVSKALYIPRADKSENKDQTLSNIDKLMHKKLKGNLRRADILRVFPFLTKYYEV